MPSSKLFQTYKYILGMLVIVGALITIGFITIKLFVLNYENLTANEVTNRVVSELQSSLESGVSESEVKDVGKKFNLVFIEVRKRDQSKAFFTDSTNENASTYDVVSREFQLQDGSIVRIRLATDKGKKEELLKNAFFAPILIFVLGCSGVLYYAVLFGIRYQLGFNHLLENVSKIAAEEDLKYFERTGINEIDLINQKLISINKLLEEKSDDYKNVFKELDIFRNEMERLSSVKESYLKTLTLDIRGPIESICGLMDLIENEISEIDGSILEKYVSYCKSSVHSLHDILRELLDVENIENNGEKLIPVVCNMAELMSDFTKVFSLKFGVANIFFSVTSLKQIDDKPILCDSGKLIRLLNILLENSIDKSHSAVLLKWDIKDGVFYAFIHETVSPNKVSEINDKNSFSSDLNLGYFRALSITRALKGKASISREEDGGKLITLEIPIQYASEDILIEPKQKIHAVIIDQNRTKCLELAASLSSLDVDVKTFQIAELSYLYLSKNLPDLVFMDLYLDGLSGQKLSSLVKGHGKVVPIVCMVNKLDAGKFQLGCDYFDYILTKPIEQTELARIVSSLGLAHKSSHF